MSTCDSGCEQFSYGKGKYRVTAHVTRMGEDVVVHLGGGTKWHVGAVVLCEPDYTSEKVTTSVLSCFTHREEYVARPVAEALCKKLGVKVVCVSGIHIDNPSKAEIKRLVSNCTRLQKALVKKYR